jgi:hypothetical protein
MSKSKRALAERLRQIRVELYGEDGVPELARRLGISERAWSRYESGITVPAEDTTEVSPENRPMTTVASEYLTAFQAKRRRSALSRSLK